MNPYPRSPNLAYPAAVLSSEGRFMRRSEVGQSESWPSGVTLKADAAPGDVPRKHALGRPWVSVRPLSKGSAIVSWLDGDRRAARNRRAQGAFRGSAKSPEERTRVLKNAATERREALPCASVFRRSGR